MELLERLVLRAPGNEAPVRDLILEGGLEAELLLVTWEELWEVLRRAESIESYMPGTQPDTKGDAG
jgi:hypothetical protein